MFNQTFENRVKLWKQFRSTLENSPTAFEDVIEFWNKAPLVSIQADPYDRKTWPGPWEMIHDNVYCSFLKILAIYYTLQLTDKFSQARFEINIVQDKENYQKKYLLYIDNICIGYDALKPTFISDLPKTLEIELTYSVSASL
jgi:hypothetical protein